MIRIALTESVTAHDAALVWPVYESAFRDDSDYETWREAVWDKHSVRSGFRLARAYDGDALVGFAYGYTGQHGQWWTDNAQKVLSPDVARAWQRILRSVRDYRDLEPSLLGRVEELIDFVTG